MIAKTADGFRCCALTVSNEEVEMYKSRFKRSRVADVYGLSLTTEDAGLGRTFIFVEAEKQVQVGIGMGYLFCLSATLHNEAL